LIILSHPHLEAWPHPCAWAEDLCRSCGEALVALRKLRPIGVEKTNIVGRPGQQDAGANHAHRGVVCGARQPHRVAPVAERPRDSPPRLVDLPGAGVRERDLPHVPAVRLGLASLAHRVNAKNRAAVGARDPSSRARGSARKAAGARRGERGAWHFKLRVK